MTTSTVPSPVADAPKATTLVFGGHIGTQTKKSLEKSVKQLLSGPNAKWIIETVSGLPQYWAAVVEKIPEAADAMAGADFLKDFDSWLRNGISEGDLIAPEAELPGIFIGPLMVAIQLDQYWRYLEFRLGDATLKDPQAELVQQQKQQQTTTRPVETLGFCAGLIAAVAVASSHNRDEFEKYGAVAVRIGLLMAVLVELREFKDEAKGMGTSVSFGTAWRSGTKQGTDLTSIVSSLSPDAYISVLFDEARATVTTSERVAPTLVRRLRAAGVTAVPLPFKGHMHTPGAERKRQTEAIIELCREGPNSAGLQFPVGSQLALPTFSNSADGTHVSADETDLAGMVLRAILTTQFNWAGIMTNILSSSAAANKEVSLVAFGLDQCIPPTITRKYGPKQVHYEQLESQIDSWKLQSVSSPPAAAVNGTTSTSAAKAATKSPVNINDESIAIVGMSIKVSGADDVDEFSGLIRSGKSQHEEITTERMKMDMLFRDLEEDPKKKKKYFGNFLRDVDAFDHRFFKRSPRESQSMDPQCRLALQGAYQAVEQSGYFTELNSSGKDHHHVGSYLGVCGVDYEQNSACHNPTAFTATGALRSFIIGRIAHYFGWTGPAMTYDTACSSSTVALHAACRDLLSGEVNGALVGGVNMLTGIQWMQNLAAGSFLSPTGQCKPFDADADGYCRGEGVAFIYLKKLSDAVADGNTVLGTVKATAVYQNLNITPLFVPNVPSLSQLFKDVIRKAGVDPAEIALVEAHGTGTAVGDPAEYESVKLALASPNRTAVVPIGSVKGHIGHTEGASGMIALVKILMMMRDNYIPAQANFKRMNPHIHASPADMMEVVTQLRPWNADSKVALLNNYGACGSNASAVIAYSAHKPALGNRPVTEARQPFRITGLDARSIAAYSKALTTYLRAHAGDNKASLADVAFNMDRQSNPGLAQALIFSCKSLEELQSKLGQVAQATKETGAAAGITASKAERPVVLCFGGQVSTFVGLDRALYDSVAVLRHHLDACDAAVTAAGLSSIFPAIFSREPIQDTVQLQTALFAMQYASARSWMDCGLASKVVSVVGHSFGEITALCVAGVLSLDDTVRLVAGRAKLVRDAWGPDSGAMMAVEADKAVVDDLLKEANSNSDGSASIACYNGPRSFTLAGTTKAIDAVAATLADSKFAGAGIKSKRLNVTNAFHSELVEKLVEDLGKVGRELTFHDAVIPIERATEDESTGPLDWNFVPSHMRKPVFFNHAVQRLAKKHPQAIFLEAGSNSTITVMASRALAGIDGLAFQAISVTNTEKGFDGLTDATTALWKQGVRVTFWPHHPTQADEYVRLLLPPYQFEKSRHWLEMKSPMEAVNKAAQAMIAAAGGISPAVAAVPVATVEDPTKLPLWTFISYQEVKGNKKVARFRINTSSDSYQRLFSSHVIAQTAPICPATLEIDMAIEALFSLNPNWRASGYLPTIHDLITHAPVCADSTRVFYMDLSPLDKAETKWHLHLVSEARGDSQPHAEATIRMREPNDASFLQKFNRLERLVTHAQCEALLKLDFNDDGVEGLQGRNVYRAFTDIVDFGPVYRGVKYVVGRGNESAGVIHKRHEGQTWLDVPMSDSFGQIAGIHVNLLTDDLSPADMYVATGCEMLMRSPKAQPEVAGKENGPGVWHVLARHERQSDKAYMTDVFVFDAATGDLKEVMVGLQYARVSKASMSKILTRFTADKAFLRKPAATAQAPLVTVAAPSAAVAAPARNAVKASAKPKPKKAKKKTLDVTDAVRDLVAEVSGVDASEITLDNEMADLGIDSLMGMELNREAENKFKCTLDQAEMMEAVTLRQFVAVVAKALGASAGTDDVEEDSEETDGDDSAVEIAQPVKPAKAKAASKPKQKSFNITDAVRDLVAEVSGVDASEITLDNEMADLGIDSLMGMELNREAENKFKCTLDQAEMMEAVTLRQFVAVVAKALGVAVGADGDSDETESDSAVEETDETASDITTPEPEEVSYSKSTTRGGLTLRASDILESFAPVKLITDDKIREYGLDNIARAGVAGSNKLCAALVVEAFDELGSPLRTAAPGQLLDRVAFLPQHGRMMEWVYGFLERDARLIDIDAFTGQITRTNVAMPRKNSAALLEEVIASYPESAIPNRLAYYAGKQLAGVLSGTTDGIRVIFGSAEGRRLVQAMYCDYNFNRMHYGQMAEVITRLSRRVGNTGEPLRVLEMGGGTGGTTNVMAPLLASLGIPVEYTFTDLSPSMVANARRKFGEKYPFMRFVAHDIEKAPAAELLGQHLVLASNAIHATRSLLESAQNVRQALRPDGFLMILEMTESLPFIDIVFGLLEGWWLFNDGRTHAIVPAEHWERDLHAAGFGHVDWTDGERPEHAFQKVIIALASGEPQARLPKTLTPAGATKAVDRGDVAAREAGAERLVASYTAGWATPALDSAVIDTSASPAPSVVIVTGATGSLGAHLVQTLAERQDVATVVCVNRQSSVPVEQRQTEAFLTRGIALSPAAKDKLRVYETDTSKAQLGLPASEYTWLVENATHIVHNAWPMSGTRPIKAFEPQLQTMRNLLDLAREMALRNPKTRIGFQFVSSIGVIGFSDTSVTGPQILEDRAPMASVIPGGYTEGKWVHERMLEETLHRFPRLFRTTATRPGQISGSSHSGFWNTVEHFAFLVKSAQALRAWPDLHGRMQWLPVDRSAGVMVDLLELGNGDAPAYPVYHIDNPVGQPWEEMSRVMAAALDIPTENIIPFEDWVVRVRRSPLTGDENPAGRIIDFLDSHFVRMSCGGIVLDTQKAKEHSATMAASGPVSGDVARKYVASWKAMGWLK